MTQNTTSSGSFEMNQVLSALNQEGGFTCSVLTDSQGLAIASSVKNGHDPDLHSAVVALVQKTISQAGQRIGMAQAEEISVYTQNGERLICRFFEAKGYRLILAVTVPDKNAKYRRLTNQAVNSICQIWSKYWE
jgi:predicted regulator of Ras-like GTPase activity (Roadblock/LC7/MglB family)